MTTRISIADVQRLVAERYGITREQITGQCRAHKYARPRQMAYKLSREFSDATLAMIGNAFDGRDHGTVHHGTAAVALRERASPRIARDMTEFRAVLTERVWAAERDGLRW